MQFEKIKKGDHNKQQKERSCAKSLCTKIFSAESKKCCAKVNRRGGTRFEQCFHIWYHVERWRFAKFIKSRPKYVLYYRFHWKNYFEHFPLKCTSLAKKRDFKAKTSLLHRPLFIKFLLLTTKQVISPATSTREKRGLLTLDFDHTTHHTLTQCSQPPKCTTWCE